MFVNGIIILKKGGGGKGSFGVRGIVYTLPPPFFFFFLFFFSSFFFLFFLSRVAAARSSKIGGYKERAAESEGRGGAERSRGGIPFHKRVVVLAPFLSGKVEGIHDLEPLTELVECHRIAHCLIARRKPTLMDSESG